MTTARRPKRRISPWWALAAVPVIAGGLTLTGVIKLPSPPNAQASSASKVETTVASRGLFRVSVTGPGTLEAGQTLDVKPEVNGIIATLPKEGDRVTKGQLVATLERETLSRTAENARLSLAKAQAQLESTRANQANNRASQQQSIANAQAQFDNANLEVQTAQTNLSNAQRLFNIGGSSAQDVRNAQSALEKAQTNLSSARVSLTTAKNAVGIKANSDTQDLRNQQLAVDQANIQLKNALSDLAKAKVYAPTNGVVSSVSGQVGGPASSAGALFTLIDDANVELPVQVDETEIAKVKVGQRAEVTLDALEGQRFTGKVVRISPKATVVSNIAVFYVRVRLANPDRALRPGMSAEAEVISEEIQDAVTVPRRAVERVRSRAYLQVLPPAQPVAEGKTPAPIDPTTAERRRVKVGPDDGANIVVTEGLEPGEVVVLPTRGSTTTTLGGN